MINDWGMPLLERNVLNQDEIDSFISGFRARRPETKKWLSSNLRKYIISDFEEVEQVRNVEPDSPAWLRAALSRGDEVFTVSFPQSFKDKIDHVVDYLDSGVDFDVTRLSVPDAVKKSEEWLKSLTRGKVAAEAPGEEVVKKYPDGYTWKKLTSDAALDREGKLMGHCVGSYCERVKAGGTVIYSLRDPKNEPHATIEVTSGEIEQIKGKQNKGVVEKYQSYAQDFVNTMGIPLGSGGESDLSKTGLFKIGDKIMTLSQFQNSKNLKVGRDLDLTGTPITSLPAGLEVGWDLYLMDTPITSLPAGLEVGGSLYLSGTPITSLPAGLKVGGDLNLGGTPITSLPAGLEVGGSLNLRDTKITSLPADLKVGGYLDLRDTKITSLPAGLEVGGSLYLTGTPITSLPDGLEVGEGLYLTGTKIKDKDVPDHLKKKVVR